MQSAYKKHHSTETALLRMTNDILRTIDRRQDVALVLLDLSAAFDTIDHVILVERLESYFGFSKLMLNWFRSYLENRHQSIIIGDQVSTPRARWLWCPTRFHTWTPTFHPVYCPSAG